MLIKSKEEIANNAYAAALHAMQTHATNNSSRYSQDPYSVMGQLTHLIALAIQAGIAEVLKNTYTNEEFEKDIGL